jgi:hypothetical protein
MGYKTLEVELEHGQVRTNASEGLPAKAQALLTILETRNAGAPLAQPAPGAGLGRFLSRRDFPLTPEQFQASMAADFWEQ